jgi:AraC-like DNA-binding protein
MSSPGCLRMQPITPVTYRPYLDAPIGLDVLDLGELARRGRRRGLDLGSPMRCEFHHLIHLTAGHIRHTADLREHVLPPGSWLWVRAGQVHHYMLDDHEDSCGTIVIWQPGFTHDEPPFEPGPVIPGPQHAGALGLALRHLLDAHTDLGSLPLEAHLRTLRLLLDVLLLRLAHARPGTDAVPAPPPGDAFRRFDAAVERNFTSHRRVADYATALGYSTRTLTRATLAATGSTAKQHIDARILLEARRLLAHSVATSAEISRRLGFTSPGDFSKFFRKHDGHTPLAFRAASRIPSP